MRWATCLLAASVFATIALTALPSVAGAANIASVTASVPTSSPTQTGRLIRDGTASACASPKFAPGLNDSSPRYYRNHTLRSSILESTCVTITLTTSCTGTNEIFSVAYDGTFDPTDPRTRWAADLGSSPPLKTSYSLVVDGGSFLSVVVHSVTPTATATACPSYTLTLDSSLPWATAIPSVSGSPAVGDVLTGSD